VFSIIYTGAGYFLRCLRSYDDDDGSHHNDGSHDDGGTGTNASYDHTRDKDDDDDGDPADDPPSSAGTTPHKKSNKQKLKRARAARAKKERAACGGGGGGDGCRGETRCGGGQSFYQAGPEDGGPASRGAGSALGWTRSRLRRRRSWSGGFRQLHGRSGANDDGSGGRPSNGILLGT
jgi:hypothetical protein